jgi:hypothetical protein
MRYRLIRCSDGYDEYFDTQRKAVLAMRWLRSTYFVVIDTETHEKMAYFCDGVHSSRLRDAFSIRLCLQSPYVSRIR